MITYNKLNSNQLTQKIILSYGTFLRAIRQFYTYHRFSIWHFFATIGTLSLRTIPSATIPVKQPSQRSQGSKIRIVMISKREFARELFMQQDLTQADIARLLKLNPRTIYRWIKQENWKRIKTAALHAPAAIADKVYYLINETANDIIGKEPGQRIPTNEQARTLNLLTNVIRKLEATPSLGQQIEVMTAFLSNLMHTNKEKAHLITNEVNNYLFGEARKGYYPHETAYRADQIDSVEEPLYPMEFEDGSSLQPPESKQAEIQVTPEQKAKCKKIRADIKNIHPYPGISWLMKNSVIDFINGGSRNLKVDEWDALLKKGYTEEELGLALLNEFSWDKERDIA